MAVNSEAYLKMLNALMRGNIHPNVWFQQEGATTHTFIPAFDWLKNLFRDKIFSYRTNFP